MDHTTAKNPTKFFGLSRNVIAMGGVSFLNDLSSDMIFPFIPVFLTSVLGATATFVGVIEGVADATASVVKIFSGRFSDKMHRRKPFVVAGYGLSAFAKPLLAFAMAPWHVLVVRFLDRIGKGTRDAPRDALLSLSVEKRKVGKAFGFHRGADTLGAALGPLIGFLLLPLLGGNLRNLFLLSFVASFFSVLIIQLFIKDVSKEAKESPKHVSRGKFKLASLGFPFLIFLIASVIFTLGKASEVFLLLRAEEVGVAVFLLPIIYFVYNITFASFSAPVGMLSDKIGHRNTFMIGMLIFSLTYFAFARWHSVFAIWFLFGAYGLYSAFTEGVGRAIVADLVSENTRATAYGIYSACTGLALLPASIIFGVLWDHLGSSASFYYGGMLGILALVLFLFLRIKNHARDGHIQEPLSTLNMES